MDRIDKLVQPRTLFVCEGPRSRIAAAGINAHLLWIHLDAAGMSGMLGREIDDRALGSWAPSSVTVFRVPPKGVEWLARRVRGFD